MQDIKLNATTTLIDQSMSPYHAGEAKKPTYDVKILHIKIAHRNEACVREN